MVATDPQVNFIHIKDIVERSVRRTAVFIALGLNLAKRCSSYDLELEEVRHLGLLPDDASEEVASLCSDEFATWIITCGLRELLENFGTYLDEIDRACNWMRLNYKSHREEARPISLEGFRYKGLAEKLALLDEMYSVKAGRSEMLISINRARHCLAHRRGIVGPEDCQKNNELEIRWLGIEYYVETPSGVKISTETPPKDFNVINALEEVGVLKWRRCERNATFKLGKRVNFSAKELGEICDFIELSSEQILGAAREYGISIGVIFTVGKQSENKWAIQW